MVNSTSSVRELIAELRKQGGITLRTNFDPLAQIWQDRPPIPENPVEEHPLVYAGEAANVKIARIRQALRLPESVRRCENSMLTECWWLPLTILRGR